MDAGTVSLISCTIAAISAIVAIISAYLSYRFKRQDRKADLERELNRILEIGIQYPRFEFEDFTKDWINHRGLDDEAYLRYDIYCNLLFNFLHHVYEFYGGNQNKIESYIDIKTWIRVHRYNWQNSAVVYENVDGYDESFRTFINSYLE